jgi:hypothetical protein
MGQRPNEPTVSDSIDEFFEPVIGDAVEDALEDEEPQATGKSRLAELRRRAEERLEEKRIQEELGYMDLDWEEA